MTDRPPPDHPFPADALAAWMKMATDFWSAAGRMWLSSGPDAAAAKGAIPGGRVQDILASSGKLWGAAAKALGEPGAMEAALKGLKTAPELSMRLLQISIEGVFEIQKRWAERLQKLGAGSEPYSFSDLDSDFLSRWTDIYKKEFQQFLNIPQLGLTRFYQEKMNQALDKYHLFQAALAEFLHLLFMPVEKSFRVMQEKLAAMAEAGTLPEDSKVYYQMWIKVMEGHYMTLFQSHQYTETMGRALDAFNQFLAARNAVLEDALKMLPVATHRDMDEITREIYELKKRIRSLEKKLQGRKPKSGAIGSGR
jgi:class III poly(R)-hydroxyalkanoic acid synthase PhaE subunit